ncbi:S26 family signal peptidase [Spirillospora sp. NPDC029432]|uniref:S26 family signal peptidase n=1 Tax=Spirillospora sp. NPDC029432 TaxID=3154599 RepID=UPI0034544F2D
MTSAALWAALAGGLPLAGALAALLQSRLYLVVRVDGDSMEPTFADGDRLLVRRRRPRALHTGQVVVASSPRVRPGARVRRDRRTLMVKRIAARPGEPVRPELLPPDLARDGATVPPGMFIVAGDNPRGLSSRRLGYLPGNLVYGVVVRRLST